MKKEISIGIFAIAAILTLIVGYKYLIGNDILDRSQHYFIRYDEVNQLERSAKVYVNGFEVGTVLDMKLDEKDADFMIVEIRVKEDISLPKNTIAVLLSEGVFGGKAISLEFDKICTTGDCIQDGDFIPGGQKGALSSLIGDPTELDAYLSKIESGLDGAFNAINDRMIDPNSDDKLTVTFLALQKTTVTIAAISEKIDRMLAESTKHIASSLTNMEHITQTLANSDAHIGQTIANLDSITTQLKNANPGETLSKSNDAITQLSRTMTSMDEALVSLKSILQAMNEGEGTLGKLKKDASLYDQLNQSLTQLELLMQDMRLNPKRYIHLSVFGKKQKDYTLPEEDPASK